MTQEIGFELKEKLAALQSAIFNKHPDMPSLLQQIHRTLKAQPENVTLLSEEEISIIINGLEVQTNTMLVKETTSKSKSTKSLASILATKGLDAL